MFLLIFKKKDVNSIFYITFNSNMNVSSTLIFKSQKKFVWMGVVSAITTKRNTYTSLYKQVFRKSRY